MTQLLPYAIFDLDGTLIDSIPYWDHIGQDYLISRGKVPEPHLEQRIVAMTLDESAEYFRCSYGVEDTVSEIVDTIHQMMDVRYTYEIPAKPGACEYLRLLKDSGVHMAICSTSSEDMIRRVLSRLGVLSFFEVIVSCRETGEGKHSPKGYLLTLERLGVPSPEQCMVYEDAFFAMETARSCGMCVTGVYDSGCEKTPEEVCRFCDSYIRDYRELIK